MSDNLKDAIVAALKTIIDPATGKSVIALDIIEGLVVKNGHVGFSIEVDPAQGAKMEPLRKACEKAVYGVPGVLSVTAVLTAHAASAASGGAPRTQTPRPQPHNHGHGPQTLDGIAQVKHIIAVASGKGGVGKSTVAVNLAAALVKLGLKVGILDADIYGPSIPRMLGIKGKPESDGKKLEPMQNHGLKCMSIGFMVDEDTPMIWRGPMVQSALTQMMGDVNWGELDVLVVDMPPGTGDAQLTMAQRVPLAGAVIVSTPQEIALIDARKGLAMFQKTEVPILGLIENMAYFVSPESGEKSYIFGEGGARRTAQTLGVPFLGEVPIHMDIRTRSDEGQPLVACDDTHPQTADFIAIAEKVMATLGGGATRPAPKIVVE
ncbi:MAG: iron-sulfur cluster carrier protein ApbC [Alphaproteobacteria bacterium]|nr:MAG: iron-sulfur cluster carrier protein ApbC [Alphaproteobacteria bacterium]